MGGGSDNASREAQRREDEERRRVNSGISRINALIDSPQREAGRQDFLQAVQGEYMRALNEAKDDTDRNNTFALARSGQIGGSVQRDVTVDTGKAHQEGILRAERGAQDAVASLRSADEDTRSRLIGMVQSGADIGNASAAGATQLRNNLAAAKAGVRADQIGDVFATFTKLAQKSREQGDYRRGLQQGVNLYEPGPWAAGAGWGK